MLASASSIVGIGEIANDRRTLLVPEADRCRGGGRTLGVDDALVIGIAHARARIGISRAEGMKQLTIQYRHTRIRWLPVQQILTELE